MDSWAVNFFRVICKHTASYIGFCFGVLFTGAVG
jgi:hypothetical protein